MLQDNKTNQDSLTLFLNFVDRVTYLLDGEKYYYSDNEPVTNNELANMFLQGDSNK